MFPSLNSLLHSGLKNLTELPNGSGFISIQMSHNLGMLLRFSWNFPNFSLWLIRPFRDVEKLGVTCVDEDPTLIIMCKIFNHIVVRMKNLDNVTPIVISPCLPSLGSNPIILTIEKLKICITNVPGGGCPSKWHYSNLEMLILLLILLTTIHHCLIFMHQLPLDWTCYNTKSKATHNA